MFTLPHNTIAVLYKQPMDMRLGMFRLQSLISVYKEHSLTKGAFYLFTNRPRTLLKAVWLDGTVIYLFSKRLEKGQFSWPSQAQLFERSAACLYALLYGKKFERVVAVNLDLTIEEAPAKDEPNAPATHKPQQNKTDKPAKRTRRLRVCTTHAR